MAGTFYGIAQLNMKTQLREQGDGAYPARVAQELAYLSAPVASVACVPDVRGSVLSRTWRLLTRPAARKEETIGSAPGL
jgi:hypothetical protein